MPRQRRYLDYEEIIEIQEIISWEFRDLSLIKGAFDSLDNRYDDEWDFDSEDENDLWGLPYLSKEGKKILRRALIVINSTDAHSPGTPLRLRESFRATNIGGSAFAQSLEPYMRLPRDGGDVSEEQLERTVLALIAGVYTDSGLDMSVPIRLIREWGLYEGPAGRSGSGGQSGLEPRTGSS